MQITPGKYRGLQRLADATGRFKMVAIDQRTPLFGPICAKRGVSKPPYDDVAAVKDLLAQRLSPRATAMLLDPIYAFPRALPLLDPRPGLILSLEHSTVQETPQGRKSEVIPGWSVAKTRRAGADAVKVLVWYRHDAVEAVRAHQQAFVRAAGEACRDQDIVHLLEILVYSLPGEDPAYMAQNRVELVKRAVADFNDPSYLVDIYKLEPPAMLSGLPDPDGPEGVNLHANYQSMAQDLCRPWVLLSAGASPEDFRRSLVYGYRAGASGYLCGRAIWNGAFGCFPNLGAMDRRLEAEALPYLDAINALTDDAATPWPSFAAFGATPAVQGAGADFPEAYGG